MIQKGSQLKRLILLQP